MVLKTNPTLQKGISLILAGVIAVAVTIGNKLSLQKQATRDTESAIATVVDYAESQELDSNDNFQTVYYPILTYEVNGETIRSQQTDGDAAKIYQIGENVNILYNPDAPEEFMYEGTDSFTGDFTLLAIGAGAVFILAGLFFVVKYLRSRQ